MEIDNAVTLLHRALELETDAEQGASLWREVGRASILNFDGEAFWTAMQQALALTKDPAVTAAIHAELAIQTASRRGMWMRRPSNELIEGWISHALDLAEPGSPERAKALIASALVDPEGSVSQAREALLIADQLDEPDLRMLASYGLGQAALAQGDYDEVVAWSQRLLALAWVLTDPDRLAYALSATLALASSSGKLSEARELAARYDEVAARLSAHHRLHGANNFVSIDALAGDWTSVADMSERAESSFIASVSTPCVFGPVMLLTCALAHVHLGDDAEGQRLQQVATGFGMEGYGNLLDPALIALDLARGDHDAVEARLREWKPDGLGDIEGLIAWLDALVALGRTAEIEEGAPALAIPGSYLEPFALRALGQARGDDALIEQAIARFRQMGLEWHAATTSRRSGRSVGNPC
jgi:tetratricopeptide (TPR) repeat protein